MKHPLIDKILTEWSFRVPNGMPNPKDPVHLIHLEESLNELRLPRKVSDKLLQNLRDYKIYKSTWPDGKAPKGAKIKVGPKSLFTGPRDGRVHL